MPLTRPPLARYEPVAMISPVLQDFLSSEARVPCAMVLSAGQGRRMGGCAKSALRLGELTVLEHLVTALGGAGVEHVSVVLGPYRELLLPLVKRCGAMPVIHSLAQPELVDSQRLALEAHASRHPDHDLMLVLGDLPLLRAEHLRLVMSAWQSRGASVQALVPTVDGTPGHPVVLSYAAVNAILLQRPEAGVREWMRSHPAHIWRLPCQDQAHVADLDSPEDLQRLRQLAYPDAAHGLLPG